MSGVGEKLIKLRTERNLSIKEVCQQAGIPPSRLVEIERGVRLATTGQIERLENFYDVKSGELAALAAISENN
ncbi:MAG: helix-turn-helix transcriptional regulator [Desulfobacterales bacterium]|nr:MAG: helix-turn-helix transcriptional regulator [Desulfobacterales bacterium]